MDISGRTLQDRYRIDEKIAESGFSHVYRAFDLSEKVTVAVKVLKGDMNRPEERIRFRTEVETLSKIDHPNIVRIIEAGHVDGIEGMVRYFLVTEYLNGKPLAEVMDTGLSMDKCLVILSQVCAALVEIHDKQMIHGDLKPRNIMITDPDTLAVKVVDFGLARLRDMDDKDTAVRGTYLYMSPEQTGLLRRRVDERSDLYSLGIIGYALLAGKHPFNTGSLSALLHEQIAGMPEPPSSYQHQVPEVLDTVILKLLKKSRTGDIRAPVD